ncbi:MAG: hypothetical protein ACU826_09395 [Gammaproteobacteria bacterium]
MESGKTTLFMRGGPGRLINRIQTLFVSLLRIWTIPIVLMLSVASGFTTYYGMSHFITPWIALVITIAIQSIIVICSLEIAGIHWKANPMRYFTIVASLVISLVASITFSYFKFYEISERDTIYIDRLNGVRKQVDDYLGDIVALKTRVFEQRRSELDLAEREVSQAYFGTHPDIPPSYKNVIGQGPFWKRYSELLDVKREQNAELEEIFSQMDEGVRTLRTSLDGLDVHSPEMEPAYQTMLSHYQDVQIRLNQLASRVGLELPKAPILLSYSQFKQGVKPSFSMWEGLSLFAFACAAMVDFFTVLLSYRLEFTAPGPLTEQEEELVFQCLRQFTEFRINENDELEMVIEKSEVEKARRYSDWARMFAVGLLLSRGFLRKIDKRTVEFAPGLYPLIAERMGDRLQVLKNGPDTRSGSQDTAA